MLAAHVVYQGHTGPFTRLGHLALGALVVVTTADGHNYRYKVTGDRYTAKAALDRAALFDASGPALALVTCGGPYNATTHSFADNLVVTTKPM